MVEPLFRSFLECWLLGYILVGTAVQNISEIMSSSPGHTAQRRTKGQRRQRSPAKQTIATTCAATARPTATRQALTAGLVPTATSSREPDGSSERPARSSAICKFSIVSQYRADRSKFTFSTRHATILLDYRLYSYDLQGSSVIIQLIARVHDTRPRLPPLTQYSRD